VPQGGMTTLLKQLAIQKTMSSAQMQDFLSSSGWQGLIGQLNLEETGFVVHDIATGRYSVERHYEMIVPRLVLEWNAETSEAKNPQMS
jgi:hypothetical protein